MVLIPFLTTLGCLQNLRAALLKNLVNSTAGHLKYENIQSKIEKGEDVLGRGYKLRKIEMDSSFPKYIIENKDKLKKWIA